MKEKITDILSEVKVKISVAASEGELQGVKMRISAGREP